MPTVNHTHRNSWQSMSEVDSSSNSFSNTNMMYTNQYSSNSMVSGCRNNRGGGGFNRCGGRSGGRSSRSSV